MADKKNPDAEVKPPVMRLARDLHYLVSKELSDKDVGVMRLVCKEFGVLYGFVKFREVMIRGAKPCVADRLQQLVDIGRKDASTMGYLMEHATRSLSIIVCKPSTHSFNVMPTDAYTTVWDMHLNTRQRGPYRRADWIDEPEDSPRLCALNLLDLLPTHASQCTSMELVMIDFDVKKMDVLAQRFENKAGPWRHVRSLRLITPSYSRVEEVILSRMVPALDSLQLYDYSYDGAGGIGPDGARYGFHLALVEQHHRNLKRLHLVVLLGQGQEDEIIPPLSLFRRIVGSFSQLEWLTIDVRHPLHIATGGRPEGFLTQQLDSLVTILKGCENLKRVAFHIPQLQLRRA